ncbi:MAG TPA: arsenate reductase ArsC [Terriglobales bacterium]|jgi:arsenate reductase
MEKHYNVLFLCTGNSARSILAEAILNFKGKPNFTAYSAGSHPAGTVRPEALHQLERSHVPFAGLRSKSWNEFSQRGAPKLDFVFTVCDNAANEVCPTWPGQPVTAHWSVPDPAAVRGSSIDVERAFREAFFVLERRIGLFLCIPFQALDNLALKRELDIIAQSTSPVAPGR